MHKSVLFFLIEAIAALLFISVSGCHPYIRTIAAVTPEFSAYEKVAILWQSNRENIYEDFFLSYWMDAFPEQMIVERKELVKIIHEQDLLPGRLNEETRARIRRTLGVSALILVNLSVQKKDRRIISSEVKDLTIKIIDTETGLISVSAVSQGQDRPVDSIIVEAIRLIKEKVERRMYSS